MSNKRTANAPSSAKLVAAAAKIARLTGTKPVIVAATEEPELVDKQWPCNICICSFDTFHELVMHRTPGSGSKTTCGGSDRRKGDTSKLTERYNKEKERWDADCSNDKPGEVKRVLFQEVNDSCGVRRALMELKPRTFRALLGWCHETFEHILECVMQEEDEEATKLYGRIVEGEGPDSDADEETKKNWPKDYEFVWKWAEKHALEAVDEIDTGAFSYVGPPLDAVYSFDQPR